MVFPASIRYLFKLGICNLFGIIYNAANDFILIYIFINKIYDIFFQMA